MPDLKDNIPERFEEQTKIVADIATPWFFIALALFASLLSFLTDLFFMQANENWFGRSGALLVGAGTWYELRLSKYPLLFSEELLKICHDQTESYDRFLHFSKIARKVGWVLIVLGTIIWAYGDLLFSKLL